jgi:hypothetical protein
LQGWSSEARWLAPFFGIVGGLFVLAVAVGRLQGMEPFAIIARYAADILLFAPPVVFLVFICFIAVCAVRREPRPLQATGRALLERFGSPASAGGMLAALFAVPVLMASYGVLKMAMPLARPFVWDDALARLDRILFLGVDPWRITHGLFGSQLPTRFIDVAYTLWVPLVMIGVLVAALAKPELRARYFLTFAQSWLLTGIVGAYLLASAGPCFSANIGAETAAWFEPLMDRLQAQDDAIGMGAVKWQAVLWESHLAREYAFGRGISAAPSMHNAICMLYVLATTRAGLALRLATRLFALLILVGSVHTGWHYVVDGLLGWAMTLAIWHWTGSYLRRVGYAAPDAGHSPASLAPDGPLSV